jgi:uncharacterized protein YukE
MATRADFTELRNKSQAHLETAGEFDNSNKNIAGIVDHMQATQNNAVARKLGELQDAWTPQFNDVIHKVREIGEWLNTVANRIEAQDASGGGGIR